MTAAALPLIVMGNVTVSPRPAPLTRASAPGESLASSDAALTTLLIVWARQSDPAQAKNRTVTSDFVIDIATGHTLSGTCLTDPATLRNLRGKVPCVA